MVSATTEASRVINFGKVRFFTCAPTTVSVVSTTYQNQPRENMTTQISSVSAAVADINQIREVAARCQAGIVAPAPTTSSVACPVGSFNELCAGARAAAVHHLSIANARRYFNDRDANRAIADAEKFASLVEQQARAVELFPEIVALLADLATEPTRIQAHQPRETVPTWTHLLAGRAETLLRHMQE